ncbi:hypothetical protein COLO4_15480 [Corchorus olitorius]|uniref:Pentacotripeptide-repeat region of PRORP domain-containing protein n=1 Tax=Corchorus olitorius TaxID=93759 RepID=A0A1R3JN31_9ROSI|nr:hypothetical protein COLO4_15480 [Corchorus olitorius]
MQGFSGGAAGAGVGVDLAQLQSTMHTIEVACTSIQMHINPTAGRQRYYHYHSRLNPTRRVNLSLVANARFQAAAAIRDAAIREWGFLSAEDSRNLISFCLCFVMQHASSPEGYVQAKVSSVAAQLMKRGCSLCREGKVEEAVNVLKMMKDRGLTPDAYSYDPLISAFFLATLCKNGKADQALEIFEKLTEVGCPPNVSSYNTMFSALWSSGDKVKALQMISEMLSKRMVDKGCRPNETTYILLIEGIGFAGWRVLKLWSWPMPLSEWKLFLKIHSNV